MDRKELTEQLGRLVHESRALIDAADKRDADLVSQGKEARGFGAEEEAKYQRINDEITKVEGQIAGIDRREAQERREKFLAEREKEPVLRPMPGEHRASGQQGEAEKPLESAEYRNVFRKYLTGGVQALNPFEARALSYGQDPEGGFTVPQEQFVRELIKTLDDTLPFRGIARAFQVTDAKSLGAPVLDSDPSDPVWTSELQTGDEDSDMDFGKRELTPYPVAKRIKVSNKLLRASAIPVDSLVRERLAYKVGTVLETAYMTGDGSNKPLGVFTASASGIPTSRDVDVGDGSAGISGTTSADKFITARYTLRAPYWSGARWLFNRLVLAAIRKLKETSTGNYLWQPGLSNGLPATFLDLPYTISEYAPGTITTGAYVAVLGDFKYYWYVDALNFSVQRLVELYAETNQTGFIVRGEHDGMPVLSDAFVRCKVSA